jgi:hypothetical protein
MEPRFPTLADLVEHAKPGGPLDAPLFAEDGGYNNNIDPNHYARFPIQPLTFITANKLEFWQGNIIKYIMRYDAKNGLEDLKKARRYLDEKINEMEGTADAA